MEGIDDVDDGDGDGDDAAPTAKFIVFAVPLVCDTDADAVFTPNMVTLFRFVSLATGDDVNDCDANPFVLLC